jgi:hypothetical protein
MGRKRAIYLVTIVYSWDMWPIIEESSSRVLEHYGGLVDHRDDHLLTLLPQEVAQAVGIPEEAQLGGLDYPLLYGSPFWDRLIQLATQGVPVLYGQIELPYLKKPDSRT